MSLLRADRVANRFNNTGPIIVGPSTVHGDFTITGDLIVAGIAVTDGIQIGAAFTSRDLTVQQQTTLSRLEVTGVTTAGIITGATYFGEGSNITGIVTTVTGQRGIVVTPGSGKGTVLVRAVDVPEALFADVSAGSTNLIGGDQGRIPYQVQTGETGFSATGNVGEILLSGGTGSPTWSSLAAINVAYADSAGISTNIFGGSGGRLVYQSNIDQTSFVQTGVTGSILIAKGSGTPEWINPRTGLAVSFAKFAGVSTNVTGGIASVTHLSVGENGSGIATFFGPLQGVDIDVSGLTTTGNLEVTGIATINQLQIGPRSNTLVGITTILDEDTLASNRDDALATQQSIKKYVDDQVTAQDLDGTANFGTFAIDLDSQTLDLRGDLNEIYITASGQQVNIGLNTDVTIANNLTVTGNAGISSLSVTGISTLQTLGVTGVTTTEYLNVAGVATVTRLNSTQNEFTNLNLTGVATAPTLFVTGVTSTANLLVSGLTTVTRFESTGIATFKNDIYLTSGNTFYNANLSNANLVGITTISELSVTGNAGIGSLNVTGITTLGVTTATSLSLNEAIVAGLTTTATLNVGELGGGASSTVYSEVTLSGQSGSAFNVTYARQTNGFTLDTSSVAIGGCQFNANSNYYYYVVTSGPPGPYSNGRIIIYSEVDAEWVVLITNDASANFRDGNVFDTQALGTISTYETVTTSSIIRDGRNIPQASANIVYATSGGSNLSIGATINSNGDAIFAGIITAAGLNVSGVTTTQMLEVTGITTINNLSVTGVATFTGELNVSGNIGINSAVLTGLTTISELDVSGDASITGNAGISSLNVTGITTLSNVIVSGNAGIGSLNVTGISTFNGDIQGTDLTLSGNAGIGSLNVTGIATLSNVTVTGNAGIGSLNVTGISTLETLDVSGSADAQFLNVTGFSTISELSVTGNAGISSLNVTGITTLSNVTVTGNAGIGSLNVTGVTTLGVTTATSLSLNEVIVSGITTTATLNVGDLAGIGATVDGNGDAVFSGIITAAGLNITGSSGSASFADITVTGNAGIGSLNVTGISTFTNTTTTGNAGIGSLNVTGISTFSDTTVTGNAGIGSLNVTGITTLGFATVSDSLYVTGIASVGTMITMYGNTGVVSATSFYGDGSNLTGVVGLVSVTNIMFVTPDGNDQNDGFLVSTAKRTVGSALTVAQESTVIKISAGNYSENNPLILPEQVTLLGDSLREVSIIPQNPDQDLIYVANGSYVENMSFTGTLNEGKAIIAFNPNKPSYVTQGPYIRNCTNFISNSIGMKIDGAHVIGDTRAMNVDSYTQLNQGGIGVSISNEGYAQLVSLFTIYNDQSVVCINGGQCDLTNSNSSFGTLGLVADGIGPTNFIGTITQFTSAGSNTFPVNLDVETASVSNAAYDAATGLTTITTHKNHNYEVGMSVNLSGLGFTCPPYPHTFSSAVANAITNTGVSNRFAAQSGTTYDPTTGILVLNLGSGHGQLADDTFTATTGTAYVPSTGILTVVTTLAHGMATGDYVKIAEGSLRFTCAKDGGATNHDYPRATDPVNNKWKQVIVTNSTTFTVNIGKSSDTSLHTWVSAVADGILKANSLITIVDGGVTFTCAKDGNATNHAYPRFTDPASGKVFGVEAITADTITLNIGKSSDTSAHTFVPGLAVSDAIIARTKAASYTAVAGISTYDGPSGQLLLDVDTAHGLTAATGFTAGAGTQWVPSTGLLTVVTTASHGMATGDYVKFEKGALTFTCTSDNNTAQIAYPRATDPVFNKWKQVTVVNTTTFTVFIGKSITGDYVHTFVPGAALAGGVKRANSLITLTDNAVSFTCTKDDNTVVKSYPAYTDPASCRILGVEAVTADTITVNVGPANLATFPDNFGRIFTVSKVNSLKQYETYVGFSTIIHGYDSGGNTNLYVTRPYDGQVVYLDQIFNTISGVTITNGGSGYTEPPLVTFSNPSESWGIQATGNAEITNGRVTGVTMISNGRGYTGTPTATIAGAATGTPDILPTYYVVSSSTPISQGISTVTFTDNVPYAVGVGTTVPFFKQSRILASSHAFEYIGSGNTALTALPQRGGVAITENEIVNKNGGLVIFTSTDQAGNFKIGEGVIINQLEGSITGDAYNRSLFANITPYILALGGD